MAGPANYGATGSYFGTYDGTNAPVIAYADVVSGGAAARKIIAIGVGWKTAARKVPRFDGNGKRIGTTILGYTRTVNIEAVIEADTIANSIVALRPPKEMTTIVLADFIGNDDTFLNATYVYEDGADLKLVSDNQAKLTFECMQELDADFNVISSTTLTTKIA
jgi:hypothetical protein